MIITVNPTGTLTIADRVGGQIDTTTNKQQDHVAQALGRLIEFWKNKPDFKLWQTDYISEIRALENAIWQVILLRFPDNAGTEQLDVLGRIVGQDRDGLTNADYLLRIKARIRANGSFGTGADVIAVLKLITPKRFRFTRTGVASFNIEFLEIPTDSVIRQAPGLISDAKAAGVGASATFITSVAAARYGTVLDPTINQHNSYGSVLTTTPKYSHYVAA